MKYRSVHEYLNEVFRGLEPDRETIIEAKLAYRKLYLKAYRRKYRESYVQVSFQMTKEEREYLGELAKAKGMRIGAFLKQLISGKHIDVPNTKEVSVLLLRAMDSVEELIEENNRDELHELLEQLETTYRLLHDH